MIGWPEAAVRSVLHPAHTGLHSEAQKNSREDVNSDLNGTVAATSGCISRHPSSLHKTITLA